MGRLAVVLAALVAACGRLGFDPTGDGGAPAPLTPTWSEPFHGSGFAHLHDLVMRADRSFVLAGHFEPDIDVGFGSIPTNGLADIILTARGADNALLWSYVPSGIDLDTPLGLATDGTDVYMTGGFAGEMGFDATPWFAVDQMDGFIMAFDAQGIARWGRPFGDVGQDQATSVAVVGSTVCISGMFSKQADLGIAVLTTTVPDLFVAGFSTGGQPKWARAAGGAGPQPTTGVAALPDGGCAFAARTTGAIDLGTGSLGTPADADLVVAVFEADGTPRWARRYAHPGEQGSPSVTAASDGSLFVGATSTGGIDFGVPTPSAGAGGSDAFILHLGPTGDPIWARMVAAGPLDDFLARPAVLVDGSILAVGQFLGAATVGGMPVTSAGSTDLFIVQLDRDGAPVSMLAKGSDREEGAYGTVADPTGGAIVGGHFGRMIQIGESTLTAVGYSDLFVTRLVPSTQ